MLRSFESIGGGGTRLYKKKKKKTKGITIGWDHSFSVVKSIMRREGGGEGEGEDLDFT
jgi:hypothetical protein